MAEGVQDIAYGQFEVNKKSTNVIRDGLFKGNTKKYETSKAIAGTITEIGVAGFAAIDSVNLYRNSYESNKKTNVDVDGLNNKEVSKADFYVKPNGDVIPSTGYRYMNSKYAKQTFESNSAPGSYFGFDKFDTAKEAREALQISPEGSGAKLRGEFDTLQIIDDIRIPYNKGDTGNILEPITNSYPEFGKGGYRQVITDSRITFKNGGLKILEDK